MITIAKRFTFDAAHHIDTLPVGHKCRRMHGHTYEVEVELRGPARPDGMVLSYEELAELWAPLHDRLDHRVLNDVPGLQVPTTEALVLWLFDHLVALGLATLLEAVTVRESATTWARLTRDAWYATQRGPGALGYDPELAAK